MKRFFLEFLLTSLVFAHILFGIIWYRARAHLRSVIADVARQNRVLLASEERSGDSPEAGKESYGESEMSAEMETGRGCFLIFFGKANATSKFMSSM